MDSKAKNQVPIRVKYKGTEIGEYYADIVVKNQVITFSSANACPVKCLPWGISAPGGTPKGGFHSAGLFNRGGQRKTSVCVCVGLWLIERRKT
jgi:hypothetical protein